MSRNLLSGGFWPGKCCHHAVKREDIIPLYKREQWPNWQKLFRDMSSSYDVWLEQRLQLFKNLKSRGFPFNTVEVDFDAYINWIGVEKLPASNETRNKFAVHIYMRAR